jgi:hypothetical protein
MDLETRQKLVARYKDGYKAVTEALAGATEAELDARPGPEKWTAREIVHHLGDSEMQSAFRLRQLLALDAPTIAAYDEKEFAKKLHYDRPIASSLAAFKAARESSAELLDRLAESDWSRKGHHPEHPDGYGMDKWMRIYAAHAHDHADQIKRARASLKKG